MQAKENDTYVDVSDGKVYVRENGQWALKRHLTDAELIDFKARIAIKEMKDAAQHSSGH